MKNLFALILLLSLAAGAWGTQKTYYVNSDISGGLGDGSSWVNAFAICSTAIAVTRSGIGATDTATYYIRGNLAQTIRTRITSATFNASAYIVFSGDANTGKWDNNRARFEYVALAGSTETFFCQHPNITFKNLQFQMTSVNYTDNHCIRNLPVSSGVQLFDGCIFRGNFSGTTTSNLGLAYSDSHGGRCIVRNCIFTGIKNGASGAASNNGGIICEAGMLDVWSCSFVNNNYSIRVTGGSVTAKNCYGDSLGRTAFWGTITKVNCASYDSSGSSGLRGIAPNTTNFTNVTFGSEDLRIPSTSALKDAGIDTHSDSAAPLNFTTDIRGFSRPSGAAWDIGPYEYDQNTISFSYVPKFIFNINTFGSQSPVLAGSPTSIIFLHNNIPSGLSIDPSTGVVSGTPTVAKSQTIYKVVAIHP
jgi:hypothetical protein